MEMNLKNMSSYKNIVETYAKSNSNYQFKNGGIDHANIVLTALINRARKEVLIYDKDISGDISDKDEGFYMSLYDNVGNKTIKIVVDEAMGETRLFQTIQSLNKRYPNSIFLSMANTEFKKSIVDAFKQELNFAVADGTSYRYEEMHSTNTRQFKALCNFNDPQQAKQYKSIFDKHFASCQSLITA